MDTTFHTMSEERTSHISICRDHRCRIYLAAADQRTVQQLRLRAKQDDPLESSVHLLHCRECRKFWSHLDRLLIDRSFANLVEDDQIRVRQYDQEIGDFLREYMSRDLTLEFTTLARMMARVFNR